MKLRIITIIAAALFSAAAIAQVPTPHIYQYTPGDGGIIYSMTRGNRWAIINLGTSASGGTAQSQLFDMDSGEHFPVSYSGRQLSFQMASNDGNIVVGRINDRAMTYDRANNVMRVYPNRPLWKNGQLTDCTPDGRYAVGFYEGYLGKPDNTDIPNDWFYRTLLVDTQTGDTIYTPNLPTTNRVGHPYQSIKFNSITPDARYITGSIDWYIDGGYSFIYDREQQRTITGTSLMALYGGNIASRYPDVESCSGSMMSPDGNAIGGTARVRKMVDGETTTVSVPCVYFRDRDELVTYPDAEDGNVGICDMDNAGTFFGITETGTPLRNFKILYQGKYWVTLNQICLQRYGFDFYERTGYERTGTIMGVSGDGRRIISFHDPMGESYCFDFGETVEAACSGLNMLSNYTVTPEPESEYSHFSTVSIQFERAVQILGNGKSIHLYDSKGQLVADGLTSSSALTHKQGSRTTVEAHFRTRLLTADEKYTFVLDSGAVATSVDRTCVNAAIKVPYKGRKSVPVSLVASSPEDGATLQRIDNVNSYILLTFDCRVRLTDNPLAYIERASDGSRAMTLNMVAGTEERTRHQVLLYPSSTFNLFADQDYRIVIEPGSICDNVADESSYNERLTLTFHGSYARSVPSGEVLFSDSWDDIAESLLLWLRYEGDHNQPLASMQMKAFDADNQPWNFSIRESDGSYDYCAGSHSMYAPSATSDDWMLTQQINLPADTRSQLQFDAQGYYPSRSDTLEVYVYEQSWVLSYLNDEWMEDIKANAHLVLKEIVSAGERTEELSGEWTHYTVDLSEWSGKSIYIAFANRNHNQSALFVDNVSVTCDIPYTLALDFDDRVMAKDRIDISGKLTVRREEPVSAITLVLRDAAGKEVSRWERTGITATIKDIPIPFRFESQLPLTVGTVNNYSIDVMLDGAADTFSGTVTCLAFEPVRRVVLEEMTGIDCPNCPQGIFAIERMQASFSDRFIPISIHAYTGDPYGSNVLDYASFLGLSSAPSARINRTRGTYFPMYTVGTEFLLSHPEQHLWYDVVSSELDRLAYCDFSISAEVDEDQMVTYSAEVRYAVTADNQQLSLLFVVLEDGLVSYQANGLGSVSKEYLGEWGADGMYSGELTGGYVYPYVHNDVARSVVGTTAAGTIGLLPSSFRHGETYTATLKAPFPTNVLEPKNTRVVGMLIDSQTGEVVNAAVASFVHVPIPLICRR